MSAKMQSKPLVELSIPREARNAHREAGGHDLRLYAMGECRILVAREPEGGGPARWHLSISHPDRYPTWDEIVAARDQLLPDHLVFVQVLPIKEHYVNVHNNCFHLWQSFDEWLGHGA